MLKPLFLTALIASLMFSIPVPSSGINAEANEKAPLISFISKTSPSLFIEDTPMELVYKKKLGAQTNLFQRYAQFFLVTKAKGNQELVEEILENESDFLKYYEAILRGLNYYFGDNKILALDMFERVYDKTHSRLINSFEGMILQDILIRERAFDKADLVSDEYCYVLLRPTDRKACLANVALLAGIKNEEKYVELLLELKKFDDKKLIEYIERQIKEIK